MRRVGHPGMVERLGCDGVLLCYDLAPVGAEMIDDGLDGLICVAKIFFVEFFNALLLDAVDDALHTDGGDGLLQVELFWSLFFLAWRVRRSS